MIFSATILITDWLKLLWSVISLLTLICYNGPVVCNRLPIYVFYSVPARILAFRVNRTYAASGSLICKLTFLAKLMMLSLSHADSSFCQWSMVDVPQNSSIHFWLNSFAIPRVTGAEYHERGYLCYAIAPVRPRVHTCVKHLCQTKTPESTAS